MEQNADTKKFIPVQPLTWDSFMLMSHEEQEALLKYITDRFSVGTSAIANDLFHISQHTLYRYIQREQLEYPMSRGGRIPEAVLQEWKKWIDSISHEKADAVPGGSLASADVSDTAAVDGTANSVGDVVRTMHDLYGRIRVTIAIEPI